MAAGTPTYPTTIDTDATLGPTSSLVANTTTLSAGDQIGITKNAVNTLIGLETMVGVTNSSVATSHEFRIRKYPIQVFQAGLEYSPPATLYGVFGVQNNRPHLAFNDSATWGAYYFGIIPQGAVLSSGLIVRLKWKSIAATTGAVMWGVQFERLNTAESSDSFDTQVTATTTTSGTASVLVETAITVTTIDGLTAGDGFGLLVQRIGANAADTLVGDACLRLISVESAA